jgi:hypothetical protein
MKFLEKYINRFISGCQIGRQELILIFSFSCQTCCRPIRINQFDNPKSTEKHYCSKMPRYLQRRNYFYIVYLMNWEEDDIFWNRTHESNCFDILCTQPLHNVSPMHVETICYVVHKVYVNWI